MNPIKLISAAKSAGLRLEIDPENRLKVGGKKSVQEQFLPLLKEQKNAILEALKSGHFQAQKAPVLQSKNSSEKQINQAYKIPYEQPYLIHYYDPVLGFTQRLPYTQTPAFDSETAKARAFLKDLYLRGVDIEITPDRALAFVPMPNKPTGRDITKAVRLQHGIRVQLDNPIDLYSAENLKKLEIAKSLDDRHSCLECVHCRKQGSQVSCSQQVKGGKFAAFLDVLAPEKLHRCKRFRSRVVH